MRAKLISGLLFLTVLWSYNVLNAQEINFKFDPPDGINYTQIIKTTKISRVGAMEKRTDESTVEARVTIKRAESGYEIKSVPVSFEMTRNGEPVNDPITNLIGNIEITCLLDSSGYMVDVRGIDKMMEDLMSIIPPEQQEMISRMVNEEMLVNKEIVEWQGRIGDFIGLSAEVGDILVVEDEMQLPNGIAMPYTSKTKFAKIADYAGKKCVGIEFAYDTDASKLSDFAANSLYEIIDRLLSHEGELDSTEPSITGWGERLIDPETMLVYSETSGRVVEIAMDIPGMGKVRNITDEKREYTFRY